MSSPVAETLIIAHMVNRAMDRAFAAANEAQSGHEGVTIELWLTETDLSGLESIDNPPTISFLVEKDDAPQGSGEYFKLGLMHTAATISRRLKAAIAIVEEACVE